MKRLNSTDFTSIEDFFRRINLLIPPNRDDREAREYARKVAADLKAKHQWSDLRCRHYFIDNPFWTIVNDCRELGNPTKECAYMIANDSDDRYA